MRFPISRILFPLQGIIYCQFGRRSRFKRCHEGRVATESVYFWEVSFIWVAPLEFSRSQSRSGRMMQGIVEWIEFPAHRGNILRKNNNRYLPRFYLVSLCPVPRERRETLIKNIVLPFNDRWSSASFHRCWFVLYDIVTHPVPDHAFYPLTSQNQHDCRQT